MTEDQVFVITMAIWFIVLFLAACVLITTPPDRKAPQWWNRLMRRNSTDKWGNS